MKLLTQANASAVHLGGHSVVAEDCAQNLGDKKEQKMANKSLKLKLTNDQRRQIKEATGKDISEVNIEVASTGQLSEKDLDRVAAGATKKKSY